MQRGADVFVPKLVRAACPARSDPFKFHSPSTKTRTMRTLTAAPGDGGFEYLWYALIGFGAVAAGVFILG